MSKVIIHDPKIDDKHTDSYWYEGLIAETKDFELRAVGDVEFECEEPQDDDDVAKMYENNQFYLNNWFEIIQKGDDTNNAGEIEGDYDSAISKLIKAQQEFDREQTNE
jgi:hypothetical protein